MATQKGFVYFDGLCVLCSREIEHYRRQRGSDHFEFVDICATDFDAHKHGVDPQQVHRIMHVRDHNGKMHTGVDAFRAIWRQLPRYQFLYRWTDNKAAQFSLRLGYSVFAKIRPYLPRRSATDCSTSPYCELKRSEP